LEIARVHIRFYGKHSFIHGDHIIEYMTDFNSFGMFKRMWYPNARTPLFKYDDQRLNILQDCAFITLTPVGLGTIGTGDMDDAISAKGLENIIGEDLPYLLKYGQSIAPPEVLRITETVFLTAFEEVGDMKFKLLGVVHPKRLKPIIEPIGGQACT